MDQATTIRETHIERLRQLRLSVTWPRLELMRIMHEANQAVSAQQIFFAQRSAGQEVPLSSIYVNLKRLEEVGIVSRIRVDSHNKSLYSLASQHGPVRLVCQHCGSLHCMAPPDMTRLMHSLCKAQGCELQDYAITLNTLCAECLSAKRSPKAVAETIAPQPNSTSAWPAPQAPRLAFPVSGPAPQPFASHNRSTRG